MMKAPMWLAISQLAPRLFQVRRRTWWLLGGGLVLLFIGLIWAAIALMGWFFGQVQSWSAAAPAVTQETLASVQAQAERIVPGAREHLDKQLGELLPALKSPEKSWREVSGTDIGPVPRYPGLVRTYWHREGRQVNVHYEGRATLAAVIAHYTQGFAARGYAHEVRAATAEAETHAFTQGAQGYVVTLRALPQGVIAIDLETTLP